MGIRKKRLWTWSEDFITTKKRIEEEKIMFKKEKNTLQELKIARFLEKYKAAKPSVAAISVLIAAWSPLIAAIANINGCLKEALHCRKDRHRLYRGLEKLLPKKDELETYLKNKLGSLFNLEFDLLLYDVTSTYFEGQCNGNSLAQSGDFTQSREENKDRKEFLKDFADSAS